MSIAPLSPVQSANNYNTNTTADKQKNGTAIQDAPYQKTTPTPKTKNLEQPATEEENVKTTKEDLEKAAEELSKVVQSMDAKLNFEVHEKTGKLMIKMVDSEGNMLKEFPPKDFLDMVARIRDYIGTMIDKKV